MPCETCRTHTQYLPCKNDYAGAAILLGDEATCTCLDYIIIVHGKGINVPNI